MTRGNRFYSFYILRHKDSFLFCVSRFFSWSLLFGAIYDPTQLAVWTPLITQLTPGSPTLGRPEPTISRQTATLSINNTVIGPLTRLRVIQSGGSHGWRSPAIAHWDPAARGRVQR